LAGTFAFFSIRKNRGIFHVHRIIFGHHDERGRRFVGDGDIAVVGEILLRKGKVTRIDNHGEIRAAVLLIRGIKRIEEALARCAPADRQNAVGPTWEDDPRSASVFCPWACKWSAWDW